MASSTDDLEFQRRTLVALLDRFEIFIWSADAFDQDGLPASPVTEIDLGDTDVEDDELRLLSPFTSLEWLCLENTPITDAGLVHLTTLRSLARVELGGTGVTDAGVEMLRRALPGCEISRELPGAARIG